MSTASVNWLAVLSAGLIGAVVAVLLESMLARARQHSFLALRRRNVMMALHAEIAYNVSRIRTSALMPVAIIPFEEPVADYLAAGPVFELVADYGVMSYFNEAVRAKRYVEVSWSIMPQGPKFQTWSDEEREGALRKLLLSRVPSWFSLAQWIEEEYQIPASHRIDFGKLQEVVRKADLSTATYLKETGDMGFVREWSGVKQITGVD